MRMRPVTVKVRMYRLGNLFIAMSSSQRSNSAAVPVRSNLLLTVLNRKRDRQFSMLAIFYRRVRVNLDRKTGLAIFDPSHGPPKENRKLRKFSISRLRLRFCLRGSDVAGKFYR